MIDTELGTGLHSRTLRLFATFDALFVRREERQAFRHYLRA